MADFYTQFSCIFDLGTAENATCAELIRGELAAKLDRHEGESLGFQMEVDHESGSGVLRIHSDECGSPEHVIRFVPRCAGDLKLGGPWASPGAILVRNHGSTLFGAGPHETGVARAARRT